jgi:hypothetical protein
MPNTFTQIGAAQVAGSGGAASFVFSSIPQTYTDLVVYLTARISTNPATAGINRVKMQINSTTTSYDNRLLFSLGVGTPGAATGTDQITFFYSNASDSTAGYWSNTMIYISNYANNLNKLWSLESVAESNNNNQGMLAISGGILSNTAAITTLTIANSDPTNFNEFSTAYLYGVSNV